MALTGTGNARGMASGISRATLPTMAGLVVAISGLYFSLRLTQMAENRPKRSPICSFMIKRAPEKKMKFTAHSHSVSDARVLDSSNRIFEIPGKRAILKWKFKAKVVDGKPVATTDTYQLEFVLEPES